MAETAWQIDPDLRQALTVDASYADAYALLALIDIYFLHLGTAYYFVGDTDQALIKLASALRALDL